MKAVPRLYGALLRLRRDRVETLHPKGGSFAFAKTADRAESHQ
jgi:hypothetical protein